VNIDRFAKVIREFEVKTQFLIVTHSKKTMAAANTISVRFTEVGENGEIHVDQKAA